MAQTPDPEPSKPITTAELIREAIGEFTSLDRGLLYTLRLLFTRPGEALRAHLAQRDPRLLKPVRLLLVTVGFTVFLTTFTTLQFPGLGSAGPNATGTQPLVSPEIQNWINKYQTLFLISGVPFVVAASLLLFRRERRSFAEHWLFNLYVYAGQNVFVVAFLLASPVLSPPAISLGYIAASFLYYIWAVHGFYQASWFSSIWKGLLAQTIASVVYFIAFIALITAITVTRAAPASP